MPADHVQDSRRPVIQLTARPDLRGNWALEVQAAFLDGRALKQVGLGSGATAAGLVAGLLELLQDVHDAGHPDVPVASLTLWTVATTEAKQDT